ncbi:MAG: hypothetical protein OEO23_14260, partial [Gemmatimonadota bacterium]|nr:hypothetical protein [Gemmatimonadota bacterium]
IFGPFDAHESHAILLCSDGFHKPLSDDGILNSVLGCKAEDAGEELTDIALRAGSDDNITIALVSFGDDSWRDEAIRARNDGWDMDDAPTIEFESEEEGWEEPEQEPASPSPEPAKREGRPQPEWILPEPEADGREPPADGLIESGFIGETISPVRPAVSRDLSAVEVLAHIDGKMAAQGPAAAPAGESQQTPTGPGDPANGEEARSEGGAETPGSKASKPESSRRSRDSGFRLVVSPAKPQRRFGPRALLAPMVLLAVIGVVVAALIGLL